ncbi:glycosyltransferase family 1 protein [Teratosphaeria destructans]|uniref:Glycosyltransferase family 1 protein n=1 Tax=Teratosphaeria destructans TaxID=418781 RepID=A0A9W7W371_9PEZI|nr:glycosyltransferase family 1 protein [Teratosphaeria destructans]
MAEGKGEERRLSAPTIIPDVDGTPLVPTRVPPAIEFDDYATPRTGPDAAARTDRDVNGTMQQKREEEEEGSYFGAKGQAPSTFAEHGEDHYLGNITPIKPAARRMITAPAEDFIRPRTITRRSSALAGLKRSATGGGNAYTGTGPYSYTFDPMPSETSSSSEDESPVKKSRKSRRERKAAKKEGTDATDFAAQEQQKKEAKQGRSYSRFSVGNDYMRSKGRVSKRDGRLNISINETANSGYAAKALGQALKHHLEVPTRHQHRWQQEHKEEQEKIDDGVAQEDDQLRSDAESLSESLQHSKPERPCLNIVIMVIGSRGDIQPFLKVGKMLQNCGHRVRIATHPTFRDFVQKDQGLEFFSVGGDPSELMAFMVKNPGLIPNLQTIREGEIRRRRNAMAVMFEGFWRACINVTDQESDRQNLKMMGEKHPFVADAIIANPPSMAHVHIAEKLGIPLHIMFTFPYTPTQMFPHPLANVQPKKSNVDESYVNFMSYPLVEMMTWQGLGDIVNKFREHTLNLEPVSSLWAPGALYRMKVPYTYMWSPSLVPKPKDWGPEIDIAGFVFLDLASNFKPDKELEAFLNADEPPVYIGFGSIVVDDPNAFTELIFKATKLAGVRALVNKGWGGLGSNNSNTPDNIFMLGNTPHDWLFPRVKAVVHHGGAGTTAIGLKCGKPTMIVPFFGDQPFWGAMVAEAKAGAHECIPYKRLTAEKLAEGIKQCLTEEAQKNVQRIADSIAKEGDGAENAVKSFHRSLPLAGRHNMRCSILEDRVAVWQLRHSSLRLSALAAELLHEKDKIKWSDLKLIRHFEWNDFDGPGEPVTGTVGAIKSSAYDIGEGMTAVPVRIAKHIKKHEEHARKRKQREERRERRRIAKHAVMGQSMRNTSKDNVTTEQQAQDGAQRPQVHREETNQTNTSVASTTPSEPLPLALAEDVGYGLKKSGGAILTMPNDLHVAIARGFHNAPRLWGDATVRKPVRITGFKSGCEAAGKEFAYGIYDGWTGLITQPVGDWRDADSLLAKVGGLGKGVGKGLGGFVLKNVNAFIAPPAYFGKGIIRYAGKRLEGPGPKAFIRKARIIQGQADRLALEKDSKEGRGQRLARIRERVDEGWRVYKDIWETANDMYGHVGGSMIKKYRFSRERQRWDANGALENINTAHRTLKHKKEGHDLNHLFAQRRKEMREAEKPRPSPMDQKHHSADESAGGVDSSFADPETEHKKQRGELEGLEDAHLLNSERKLSQLGEEEVSDLPKPHNRKLSQVVSEGGEDSDATAVAEEQGEKGDVGGRSGAQKHTRLDDVKIDGIQPTSALAGEGMVAA